MASDLQKSLEEERAGATIAYGAEDCNRHITELLQDSGFPKGVLPLIKELVEFGYVRKTGFTWMKQKAPYKHYFTSIKMVVSYTTEVTAYIKKGRMKKISGVKGKQLLFWVPAVEMSIDEDQKKIYLKTPLGIEKSYPITAFMTDEEKQKYMEKANE